MSSIEDVLECDRQRIRAMLNKDIGSLTTLLADDLLHTHENGRKDNRDSLIAAMLSGATAYRRIEPVYTDTRDFGDTVVLAGEAGLTVSTYGERDSFDVRFTAVWVRHGDGWRIAVWQSTRTAP